MPSPSRDTSSITSWTQKNAAVMDGRVEMRGAATAALEARYRVVRAWATRAGWVARAEAAEACVRRALRLG